MSIKNSGLRIAQIASLIESVPPYGYGGTERVIYALTEELVHRGHDVTLFASGDSRTSAKLEGVCEQSLRRANSNLNPYKTAHPDKVKHIQHAYSFLDQFDIVHDHIGLSSLKVAEYQIRSSMIPLLSTVHIPINDFEADVYNQFPEIHVVTLSDDHGKEFISRFNHAGKVYNGLDMEDYPHSNIPDNYLLFVGRISAEKGLHDAIEVARRQNMRLLIAAKLDPFFKDDVIYFKRFIEPKLGDQFKWLGEVNTEARNHLMANSTALLHPVQFREPFGLTLIESMACGTPVIAFSKGAIPEIISHGQTGFVVASIDQMVNAVNDIKKIDRSFCRKYALSHFGVQKMVDNYEKIYGSLLVNRGLPYGE